jgi:hypothetical protein
VKIREIYQPIERKALKFRRNSACTPSLQKSFVNSKEIGVKRRKSNKFEIILKGEFTKYRQIG